jgi:hypothetical protein
MMLRVICAAAIFTIGLPLAAEDPQFNKDNELLRPIDYREWVYVSTGLGMSYGPASSTEDPDPSFDTVFVRPSAYQEFVKTGKWPDKTIFVLEVRKSASHGSINNAGHYQTDLLAVEAAVKDEARFKERWAYFGFGGPKNGLKASAKAFAPDACNACHAKNGATDNTFVQFYPTLLSIAKAKGTLKPEVATGGTR